MNLPEILNVTADLQNQQLTSKNTPSNQRQLKSQVSSSRKKLYSHNRRRTNTVMGERTITSEDNPSGGSVHFNQHNYNHLKTVGEDDTENKLSKQFNKDFDYMEYQNSIKLYGQIQSNRKRDSGRIVSEDQRQYIPQDSVQQININTNFSKFFKKKLRVVSTTPSKNTTTTTNRSTQQNSSQSSPLGFQQKEIQSLNNYALFSRRSTIKQGVSPDNESKLISQNIFNEQQNFHSTKAIDPLKHETSISRKGQQKFEVKNNDTSTPHSITKYQHIEMPSLPINDINISQIDRFSSAKIKRKFRGANGLTPQIIELWINDTLLEAQSEKYSQSQQSEFKQKPCTTLSAFSLERKNLLSKGVKNDGIDRIYRSLFVYSFGFYEMLYEILEHLKDKDTIIAQIWRVYGILLEYCARGDFTVTVNLLEKNKDDMVETLNKVIAEKVTHIKHIEIKEQNQTEKYLQEIHKLTQEIENLNNDRMRLEEDNKVLDEQFNTEAKMRLQFEHKINELYSIHRELNIKQQRLLVENDYLEENHKKLKLDYNLRNEEKQIYLMKYTDSAKELEELKLIFSRLNERIKGLEETMIENNIQNGKISQQNKELNEESIKKQLKINELIFQVDNLKSQNKQCIENQKRVEDKKSQMLTEKDYYEQRIKAQQDLLNEIQVKLNLKENFYSEISYKLEYNEIKLKEKTNELKEKANEIQVIQSQNKGLQIDLEVCQNAIKNYEVDNSNLEKCVREYKLGQADTENLLVKANKQIGQMTIQINQQVLDLKKQISLYENLETKQSQLQNEYRLFKESNSSQMIALKTKLTKQEQELKKSTSDLNAVTKQFNLLAKEKDSLQNELFDMQKKLLALKDANQEKHFQNTSIESVLGEKEKIIDELNAQNIQILANFTDYKIRLEQSQRQLVSITAQYDEFQKTTDTNIQILHRKYLSELSQFKCLEMKVHSMEYEDALAQISRYEDVVSGLKEKIKEKDSSIQFVRQQRESTEENRRAVDKQKSELVSKLQKLQNQYDKSLQEIQSLKLLIDQQKISTISQQEQLSCHFQKQIQEEKQNYEGMIKGISENLSKQVKELEAQLTYTLQKNIAYKDQNDLIQKEKDQLESEIVQIKNQKNNSYSPNKIQNTIQSRPNSKQSTQRNIEPLSPQKSQRKENQMQAIQVDKEVQTSSFDLATLQVNQKGEIENQVLQNITNLQQINESQCLELYKYNRQHQDSIITNNQTSIEKQTKQEKLTILQGDKQQQFCNRAQSAEQESNNRQFIVNQRQISTAYEQLKPKDRYPTDKYTKKPQIFSQLRNQVDN